MTHEAVAESKRSKSLAAAMAALLILTTVVEILAIYYHPHVQNHDQPQTSLQIVAISRLAGWIHGVAIGCSLLIAYCLGELLRSRVAAPLMRAAALVYAAGIVGWILATTVDGWVLERLASTLAHDTPSDIQANARLFVLCMAWVTASTNVGVALTSVAIFLAAAGLFRNGRSWQIAGSLGLLAGIALFFSIVAGVSLWMNAAYSWWSVCKDSGLSRWVSFRSRLPGALDEISTRLGKLGLLLSLSPPLIVAQYSYRKKTDHGQCERLSRKIAIEHLRSSDTRSGHVYNDTHLEKSTFATKQKPSRGRACHDQWRLRSQSSCPRSTDAATESHCTRSVRFDLHRRRANAPRSSSNWSYSECA